MRVLIFGGSGILVHRLCRALSVRMETRATFCEAPDRFSQCYEELTMEQKESWYIHPEKRGKNVIDTVTWLRYGCLPAAV